MWTSMKGWEFVLMGLDWVQRLRVLSGCGYQHIYLTSIIDEMETGLALEVCTSMLKFLIKAAIRKLQNANFKK